MPTEEETYRKGVKDKLDQILTQTTKTNGRVTLLEEKLSDEVLRATAWRNWIGGGLAVLSLIMIGVLIPLIAAYISR